MVKTIYPGDKFRGFSTVGVIDGNYKLTDIDLVKRDLLNEFMTPQGSRRRLPLFGSIIWGLIFEPMTSGVASMIKDDITRIVNRDPRLELIDVSVYEIEYGFGATVTVKYNPTQTVEVFTANFDQRVLNDEFTGSGTL
jgi:phage baseplate assembly protein W